MISTITKEMIWEITVGTFLATVFVVVGILYILFRTGWNKPLKKPEQQRPERRRSMRLLAHVPVLVFRDTTSGEPAFEETTALGVNAHGGLLNLAASPRAGQRLWLTNKVNHQERECHVVRLGSERRGKTEVAIEFARPVPDFWHAES